MNNQHEGTRFGNDHLLGKLAQELFDDNNLRVVMKKFVTEVESHDLTSIEVAARWIAHHSFLADGDGIILAASKESQILETTSMIRKGPLPEEALRVTNELWNVVKGTRSEII